MASLIANGRQQYFGNDGNPLVGGKLYTYLAGTTTPKVTYQDADGTVPNTNPIILDARGEAQVFWSGSYKVTLKDSLNNTIWTVDKVTETNLGYRTSSNGSAIIPAGTTAQRDAVPLSGYFRYNVDFNSFEGYYAAAWKSLPQSVNGVVVPNGGDILLKTVGSVGIVGAGNVDFKTVGGVSIMGVGDIAVQAPLVSGTNIKTINGLSILGAGDLAITAPGGGGTSITGNVTLTVSSPASMFVTPTAPGLYATLPDATTLQKADNLFSIYNAGEYDYGVKNSAGTQLGWVRAKTGAMLGLADSSTAAGVWVPYGLEKLGVTAFFAASTTANTDGSNALRRVALDANRTCFVFGGTSCYAVVYDASTQTWGTPTLIRSGLSGVSGGAFVAILSGTNQVLVCSSDATTAFQAVTLTISGTGVTVNANTAIVLAGTFASIGMLIAVGTSWVVSYGYTAATVSAIRAMTISGTAVTIGAESILTPAVSTSATLYVSGAVVRTVNASAALIYAKPYTVTGSALAAGTEASTGVTQAAFRSFQNGNGNLLCEYINTTHFAAVFKLTGTVEAVSAISIGTVPTNISAHADYVAISATKTLFIYDASGTSWFANIITDTAGTATAGTEINGAHSAVTAVMGIAISGNNARVGVVNSAAAQTQLTMDCSGASPVLSSATVMSYAGASLSGGSFAASDLKGARSPNAVYGGTTLNMLTTFSSGAFSLSASPSTISRGNLPNIQNTGTQGNTVGAAANDTWFGGAFNGSTTGVTINHIEAAA